MTLARIEAGVNVDPDSVVLLDADAIIARAGSNRVEPGSGLRVGVEIAYQNDSSSGDIQVLIHGWDDLGNLVEYDGGLPIR